MLTIRCEQMTALAEEMFVARLVRDIQTQFAEYVPSLEDAFLREQLRAGLSRGREYRLTWKSSLGTFAILQTIMGRGFDDEPTIRSILTHPRLPPDRRIDLLVAGAAPATWENAIRCADARAGNP